MDKKQFPAAVDHSVLHKPYQVIMWFFFLVWAGYVVWTWSAAIQQGTYQVLAFVGALQALLLWYMVNTYTARTEYRLEEDELVIVISRKFKGVKEIHLGYNDIFGVYRMKKENTKAIETAPAYYAYSRLDKREIWVLLYNYNDDTKKAGRILMKASDEFWEAFKEIMPDQICVPQAEVLGYAYKHMGDVLRRKKRRPPRSTSMTMTTNTSTSTTTASTNMNTRTKRTRKRRNRTHRRRTAERTAPLRTSPPAASPRKRNDPIKKHGCIPCFFGAPVQERSREKTYRASSIWQRTRSARKSKTTAMWK